MSMYLGDFVVDATVNLMFSTHEATGARVDPSTGFEAADIRVYKGISATQRASEAGYTMVSPFDEMVGVHALSIDLSDNTDAGFYAAGNDYTVVLYPDETVDDKAISAVLGHFSIENRYMRGTDSAYTGTPPTTDQIKTAMQAEGTTLHTIAIDVAGLDGAAMRGTNNAYTGTPPTTDQIKTAMEAEGSTLHTINGNVDSVLLHTGTDGVVVAGASKTGYGLASDGLDSVAITAPTGVASNFREMVVQVWRRLFKKSTLTTTQLKTYADNGTSVLTTQVVSDDAETQTQGAAT